jgi:hypothetical protein
MLRQVETLNQIEPAGNKTKGVQILGWQGVLIQQNSSFGGLSQML